MKPALKCAWNFLCDECDEAGVWAIDAEMMAFCIGEDVDLDELIAAANEGKARLEKMGEGKIWIKIFVEFQYGKLSENCKPHLRIIQLLKKYGLLDRVTEGYTKGIDTLEDKDKEKETDKEKEKEEGGSRGKPKRPNIKPDHENQTEEKRIYREDVLPAVEQATEMRERKRLIADFIVQHKPLWIYPYGDLWNLAAQGTKLSQIVEFTESRQRKFSTRVREPSFDFLKILEGIRQSPHLQGQNRDGWKADWDWIMCNDTNYLKILEGKYK